MEEKNKNKGYYIFRASKMVDGVKIYARDYGKKAFKIFVYVKN